MCYHNDLKHTSLKLSRAATTKNVPCKRGTKAKKSVRFSGKENASFRRTAITTAIDGHHHPPSTWYQPQDYEAVKDGIRSCLYAVQKVNGDLSCLDENDFCFRGLESAISSDVRTLRKMWIKTTIRSVLDEQTLQKSAGTHSPDRIAAVATACTWDSSRCAAALAALDAHNAK